MKKIIHLLVIIFALSILITSCTMQKRVYMSGYDVEWKKTNIPKSKINNVNNNSITTNKKIADNNNLIPVNTNDIGIEENYTASINNSDIGLINNSKLQNRVSINPPKDSCDDIVLKDGTEIQANIDEVGESLIKYRKCNLPYPIYSISKEKVLMIKYANGTKDIFKQEVKQPETNKYNTTNDKPKVDGFGIASFATSIVGTPLLFLLGALIGGTIGAMIFWAVGAILALIFGFVSLSRIKRHPEKHKGKGFGIAGICVGGLLFLLELLDLIAYLSTRWCSIEKTYDSPSV